MNLAKEQSKGGEEKMRVLRIAHSSLTPELRQRERALARCYPDVDLEVITTVRWREAEMDVEATPDDLFPVRTATQSSFKAHSVVCLRSASAHRCAARAPATLDRHGRRGLQRCGR